MKSVEITEDYPIIVKIKSMKISEKKENPHALTHSNVVCTVKIYDKKKMKNFYTQHLFYYFNVCLVC